MCHPKLDDGASKVKINEITNMAIKLYGTSYDFFMSNESDEAKSKKSAKARKKASKSLESLFDSRDTPSFDEEKVRIILQILLNLLISYTYF